MSFQQFLRWFVALKQIEPCVLRELLIEKGIKSARGTPTRWLNGTRTPDVFVQKKVATALNAETVLSDNNLLFIPKDINMVAMLASSNSKKSSAIRKKYGRN